jgi:NTP pyrophosphatase (non-canonical NTP hydrolase)
MTLNEYQTQAMKTRLKGADILYAVMNLAAEAGEVAGKFAKARRDYTSVNDIDVAQELGDVLWQVAAVAASINYTLDEIATLNLDKLASRQARGTLSGSGDDR